MSYSTDVAKLVADQLSLLVTLNRHQLAGQAANLDFWLGQVRNGLEVIDGYGKRFQRLTAAQTSHVTEHHTIDFSLDDPCCTQGTPPPPRRVPDGQLRDARRALCEAARRFFIRCYHDRLIGEQTLQRACNDLGIVIDAGELRSQG